MPNGLRTTHKRFANQMCVCMDGTANLRYTLHKWFAYSLPQTVRLQFAANQNLSVFCTNTKRTGCAGCSFHAPGVLCSPQARGKLINRAPNMCHMRMAQCVSSVLVYTRFNGKRILMALHHYLYTQRYS